MRELFLYFLRLGALGFGGPLALVAQMQKELVQERKWMAEEEFRRAFALIKAMPGPVAFQTAVFLAHRRRGFIGALIGGLAMILPSFLLMLLLAIFYSQMAAIPLLRSLMMGMQLGAFVLILGAMKSLAGDFLRHYLFWVLFCSGLILSTWTNLPEPVMIIFFGLLAVPKKFHSKKFIFDPILVNLTLVCLKAGAFVFGTGLAIVPFLEGDFVSRLQWISHSQFMDALAFGQLTPGPVVITVTFIGYKVAGLLGATVATVGIFLPAFIHMTTWFPRVLQWLQTQKWIGFFTLGVTAAVCSSILTSLIHVAVEWNLVQLGGACLLLLIYLAIKMPSWALVFLGGSLGVAASFF